MDFEAQDKKLEFDGPEMIRTDELQTFPYEYAGRDAEIEIVTDEFTSVCPFSGLPDFGKLILTYTPDAELVELRSLKYYMLSYRNVGIYYEHLINRMLEDLVACVKPKRMVLRGEFSNRGGIRSTITASYPR